MVETNGKYQQYILFHFEVADVMPFYVTAGSWYNKKSKQVKVYNDQIEVMNPKDNSVQFTNSYEELLGITKSLRIGSKQFIVHFKTRADEEWLADRRDEMIVAIAEKFRAQLNKGCHIFGVSSPNLDDYLTTDKDLLIKICKMPN